MVLTCIGAFLGVIFVIIGFLMPGAPQQAAMSATACAVTIIPYVLWRTSQLGDADRRQKKMVELLEQMAVNTKPVELSQMLASEGEALFPSKESLAAYGFQPADFKT